MGGIGLRVGSGFIAVGTGSQTVSVLDSPSVDPSLVTHTFATLGAVGAGWYRIGAVQNAGLSLTKALAWLGADIAEAVEALRAGVRASDPIFVPYLAGERTPFMDASLRGVWSELSLATDRPAMLRSILEGVAQAVALGVQAVEATGARLPATVPIVGGGTHDPAFRQLLASATGHVLGVTDAPNAAVVGAALLAQGRTSAEQPAEVSSIVEPEPDVQELLAARRERMVNLVRTQEPREQP
jgi:xylulokinase